MSEQELFHNRIYTLLKYAVQYIEKNPPKFKKPNVGCAFTDNVSKIIENIKNKVCRTLLYDMVASMITNRMLSVAAKALRLIAYFQCEDFKLDDQFISEHFMEFPDAVRNHPTAIIWFIFRLMYPNKCEALNDSMQKTYLSPELKILGGIIGLYQDEFQVETVTLYETIEQRRPVLEKIWECTKQFFDEKSHSHKRKISETKPEDNPKSKQRSIPQSFFEELEKLKEIIKCIPNIQNDAVFDRQHLYCSLEGCEKYASPLDLKDPVYGTGIHAGFIYYEDDVYHQCEPKIFKRLQEIAASSTKVGGGIFTLVFPDEICADEKQYFHKFTNARKIFQSLTLAEALSNNTIKHEEFPKFFIELYATMAWLRANYIYVTSLENVKYYQGKFYIIKLDSIGKGDIKADLWRAPLTKKPENSLGRLWKTEFSEKKFEIVNAIHVIAVHCVDEEAKKRLFELANNIKGLAPELFNQEKDLFNVK